MNLYYKYFVYTIISSFIFSQSTQDYQKAIKEYERLERVKQQKDIFNENQIINLETGLPKEAIITPYDPVKDIKMDLDLKIKYFGYDFFTKRDSIPFWENLPTPAGYILGPGDELVISVWGETQLRETYIINRDGKIYDAKVGVLNLAGKTIKEARLYFNAQFGRVYSTLKSTNPTTFMDVSLGQLRSINVNFVGELAHPGVYPIHPFSTVVTGLIQAGGIETTGTLRNILIKREGKTYSIIDLYDYLIKGSLPKNIQLRDQDVVVVPVRLSHITVDSSVVRPGVYESTINETVVQMIKYAGGLTQHSSSTIGLKRIIPLDQRDTTKSATENYYIDYRKSHLTTVQNGDIITVKSIIKTLNQVEIIGQVKNPGMYNYSQNMNLKDLVVLAGGFSDTTFWKSVYQNRGELVRRDPKTRYESVIEINLYDIMNEDGSENIKLQNLDRFVVHANLNFFEKQNVQILGEVNIPGSYPLISDGETLNSLINRAGGLTSKALPDGVAIYRDKKYFEEGIISKSRNQTKSLLSESELTNKYGEAEKDKWIRVAWQNENIQLMAGDSVIVKEITGTVNIYGEVYNPGLIEYQKGKSLKYYVDSAGGVTLKGDKNDIIVIYANGVIKPKKLMSSPKIRDGATIIVNMKEETEPFNPTEFSASLAQIATSVMTILILKEQLSK